MRDDSILTSADHRDFDRWVATLLDRFRDGEMTRSEVVSTLGQVFGALDIGNLGEVRAWLTGSNDPKK